MRKFSISSQLFSKLDKTVRATPIRESFTDCKQGQQIK